MKKIADMIYDSAIYNRFEKSTQRHFPSSPILFRVLGRLTDSLFSG